MVTLTLRAIGSIDRIRRDDAMQILNRVASGRATLHGAIQDVASEWPGGKTTRHIIAHNIDRFVFRTLRRYPDATEFVLDADYDWTGTGA